LLALKDTKKMRKIKITKKKEKRKEKEKLRDQFGNLEIFLL
jgi:Ser-tRNA(Ala) deacylase AlaX